MRYCASFYQQGTTRQKLQEIRYKVNNFNAIIELIANKSHGFNTILVEIPNLPECGVPVDKLMSLGRENPELLYDFHRLEDLTLFAKSAPKCRYMFHYQVSTWALVKILMFYRVSDMLLGEPIVFESEKIAKYIKSEYPINIRICPHTARPVSDSTDDGLHHFWVLPQHIELYENIVDVVDLTDQNPTRETALVNIYTSGEPYNLPMNLLFKNFDVTTPATAVIDLAKYRKNCGQRCMVDGSCHRCDLYITMYQYIKDIGNEES